MLKEASKILEIIMEFCHENLNMVIIAGVALGALIIIIFAIKFAKKEEVFDFEFDSEEFAEILEEVTRNLANIKGDNLELVCIEQPRSTLMIEVPKKIEIEKDDIVKSSKLNFKEGVKKKHVVSEVKRGTLSLEDIVEEIAEITGDGVKSVEIKIPGAEVKITYVDEGKESKRTKECGSDGAAIEEVEGARKLEDSDCEAASKEEEQGETLYTPKRFGPENMNVARSGKVYSEAELEEQIKD